MIRKYKEEEIPKLIEIWEKAASQAHPFLSDEFNKMVKKAMTEMYLPNSDTWVYVDAHKIIGFVSMNGNEIGGLFISPEKQSKGIGTSLVNHVKLFHEELEVEVFQNNKIGRPFYEKYGFVVIKEYIHDATNEKVLRMKYSENL